MANILSFDEYKAVIDYITNNTGSISASLEKLVENALLTKKNTVLNIISSDNTVKTITMGTISIDLENKIWKSEQPIILDLNGFDILKITHEGDIPSNALLPKTLTDDYLGEIAKHYISKGQNTSYVSHYYDSSVTNFNNDEVPSLKYFLDNYYTIFDVMIDKKVVITSRDINDFNNVVTYAIANLLSGAPKNKQKIDTSTESFFSNLLQVGKERAELYFSPNLIIISDDNTIKNAYSEKSVVLPKMLDSILLRKDLSNAENFFMQEPVDSSDDTILATHSFLNSEIKSRGKIEKDKTQITVSQSALNSMSINFAESSFFDNGSPEEKECITNISNFSLLENYLKKDKDGISEIEPIYNSLIESASDRAASIKTLYNLLSSKIASEFPDAMINAVEKLALSSQLNFILKDDETIIDNRPVLLKEDDKTCEIATFNYASQTIGTTEENQERSLTSESWSNYVM